MSHLGQRISALIDGELSDSERDRVLAHIAGCDACRQEAVALRVLKQRMHSLGEAMVDAALTGRLMAMDMSPDGRPWSARPPWRTRGGFPAARMLTAGLLASTVAGLGAAAFFAGGEQQAPGPKVTPAVDTFLVQHAIVIGDLPVTPTGEADSPAGPVPAAVASGVPAGGAPAGTAAARSGAGAARLAGGQPAGDQPADGRSAGGQAARGRAAGMVRRGLLAPVAGVRVPRPAATVAVSASASAGP